MGLFDGEDPVCIGNPEAADEVDRSPCGVRAKCASFKAYCDDNDIDRGRYLKYETASTDPSQIRAAMPIDEEEFDAVCELMAGRKGIVETDSGVEEGGFNDDERRSDYVPKARPRKLPNFTSSRHTRETKDLVNHFRKFLIKQIPSAAFNVPPRAILPGEIVEVDKSTSSKYLSYYFHGLSKVRIPLAKIVLMWRADYVDIQLPLTVEQLTELVGQRTLSKLKPLPFNQRGKWESVCRRQRKEGLALAAEAIGWAIRKELISVKLEED